ncbi:hypothetical protein [Vulcanococcus sp.]|uniref:hypothetical protein n=1 Tax=Vulcanococcus sp. TaxID=2856995 RepID=UPI003C0A576B
MNEELRFVLMLLALAIAPVALLFWAWIRLLPQNASSIRPAMTAQPAPESLGDARQSHDFDTQKELHQQIRNDPDYDDWEYGTEPLPHEAWVERSGAQSSKG